MIDDDLQDQAMKYLLGEIQPAEAATFERRLAGDATLRAYVQEREWEVEKLATEGVPQVDPPSQVRARLLAAAAQDSCIVELPAVKPGLVFQPSPQPGRWDFSMRLLAEAALLILVISCVGLLWRTHLVAQRAQFAGAAEVKTLRSENENLRRDLQNGAAVQAEGDWAAQVTLTLRQQVAAAESQVKALRQQLAQAQQSAPAERQDVFAQLDVGLMRPATQDRLQQTGSPPKGVNGARAGPAAEGVAIWDPKLQTGMLQVENLPVPKAEQDYQIWVADPAYAQPIPGDVFHPSQADRRQTVSFTVRQEIKQANQFMVTLERKGGASRITGPAVLQSVATR